MGVKSRVVCSGSVLLKKGSSKDPWKKQLHCLCAQAMPVQALALVLLRITSSFVFQAKLSFKNEWPLLCHFLLLDEEDVEVFVVCSSRPLPHRGPLYLLKDTSGLWR